MQDLMQKAAAIRLVIFDVDGVLTDGAIHIDDDGRESKAFHSRDGHGMKMLLESGVEIGIITGRSSEVVRVRMESLGIRHIYQGCQEKLPFYEDLIARLGLSPHQVAYVGDDVVDLPVMLRVGLAVAVQDAHGLTKRHAHWLTPSAGGRGAARELCELIMEAQETLQPCLARYLA